MRNLSRALLAGGLGFAVSCIIAACGGGAGLLSGDQANSLTNQLSQISAALTQGHCRAAQSAAHALVVEVANLPATVSTRLREDLDLGASTISTLAAQQCHPARSQTVSTPTTAPASTPTTSPTTTPTTPPPPTHTSTTPTTTSQQRTSTTGPPSGGGGLGGSGGGPGNGSGGGGGGQGPPAGQGAGGGTANG